MCCQKGLQHIYAQEHKLYHYYYHFEGHWENKNRKNDNKNVWSIFLSPTVKRKGNKHCNGLHFSLVYFIRLLKYILAVKFSTFACKMHHNVPQSDSNYHRIIHELLTLVSWLFWYQIFVFQVPMDMAPHSFFILFIFSLLWINPMMSLSK